MHNYTIVYIYIYLIFTTLINNIILINITFNYLLVRLVQISITVHKLYVCIY